MQFGLFFINERAPGFTDTDVMKNTLEQCRVADEGGYDYLWFGEHHFAPYGTMADTMVYAAAASQVTKRIRIGNAVIVPAFQHPVRVAEQVAMLDLLSDGRYTLGVGRGYQAREFKGFNVPHNESKERFRESVTIIEGLIKNETFTYHGKFWDVDNLTIAPRPAHDIPIYVAVSRTPESFEWAIQQGYGILGGNPYAFNAGADEALELYLEALRKAGQSTEKLDKAWGLINNVFVLDTSQEARAAFRHSWELWNQFLWKWARVVDEGQELPDDYKAFTGWMDWIKDEHYEDIFDYDTTLIGSPDEVVDRVHRLWETQKPMYQWIISMNRGGCTPQKEILRSMELFAEKVIPQVRHLGEPEGASVATATTASS
jgi:alkanesulfonate monooxygenase SsuD/methylene tetrahydromethanopterin reductase-like flavin-dependent oxidoreductase (luciferase family)